MATDGLWDELDKEEVKKLVQENDGNKENIISSLYSYAFQKAAKSNRMTEEELKNTPLGGGRRKLIDDISIIVLDL